MKKKHKNIVDELKKLSKQPTIKTSPTEKVKMLPPVPMIKESKSTSETIETQKPTQPYSLDMKKISNYLAGSTQPQDAEEVSKLQMLINNYSKAGNTFLHMMVYKYMERVGKLVDILTKIEGDLYTRSMELEETSDIINLHKQISSSIDKAVEFINKLCNDGFGGDNKIIHNNILINNQMKEQDLTSENHTPSSTIKLTKQTRQNIRKLLNNLNIKDK